jgi:hypothetical protein
MTDPVRMLRDGTLPSEYFDGAWRVPSEAEPHAIVTYAIEPSPETGHVGWCWWALGKMGEAPSYEDAKLCAEAVMRRSRHD